LHFANYSFLTVERVQSNKTRTHFDLRRSRKAAALLFPKRFALICL
jgi:hypothetical protein